MNVDIIMPAYNCEKYIKYAIASVKAQTNKNWNLIIIDDASTDNTLNEIYNNIKDIKQKVKVIVAENHIGVAKARNLGIENSTSKYIAFLDSDDIWKKEKLEKQINFMQKNNYYFTYTSYIYVKNGKEKQTGIFPTSLNYKQALKNTFILTSTVIIDTENINKELIKMPNIASEDTATWWTILKAGSVAYGLNESLTFYRVSPNALSSNKFRNLKRTWDLYRKHEKLPLLKSINCFKSYALNACKKRII